MNIQFSSIKVLNNRIQVSVGQGFDNDDYEDDSIDITQQENLKYITTRPPTKAVIDALSAMTEDVLSVMEMPKSKLEKIHVQGVTIKYNGSIIGIKYHYMETLEHCHTPFNAVTPAKFQLPLEAEVENKKFYLTDDQVERLETLKKAIIDFLKSRPKQLSLFDFKKLTNGDVQEVEE